MSKRKNVYKGRREKKLPNRGSKHDNIVDSLEQRLKNSNTHYSQITKEENYTTYRGKAGEVDDYAIFRSQCNKYLLLFEVKTTDNHKNRCKAHQQLLKDRAYYSKLYNVDRTFLFYVHSIPKTNEYKINWYVP